MVGDWTNGADRRSTADPLMMVGVALLVFPKLALGLSGFETGVAVMPQIDGRRRTTPRSARPAGSAAPAGCSPPPP